MDSISRPHTCIYQITNAAGVQFQLDVCRHWEGTVRPSHYPFINRKVASYGSSKEILRAVEKPAERLMAITYPGPEESKSDLPTHEKESWLRKGFEYATGGHDLPFNQRV